MPRLNLCYVRGMSVTIDEDKDQMFGLVFIFVRCCNLPDFDVASSDPVHNNNSYLSCFFKLSWVDTAKESFSANLLHVAAMTTSKSS